MASYAEIQQQIAELEKQAEAQFRVEKAGNIQQVKQLMQQLSVTAEDICPGAVRRRGGAVGTARKGAIRYANPAGGKGWTGHGRKPQWVVDALAAGRRLEEFAV
jgi:DNA-binding protein H-NS